MPNNLPKIKRIPLYSQVQSQLEARIYKGEWLVDEALPNEWDLAKEYSVSQGTVRKALLALTSLGVVYREQGRGTFVASPLSDWPCSYFSLPGQMNMPLAGLVKELLSVVKEPGVEEVCDLLKIRRYQAVWKIRLLWRLSGKIVALDEIYLEHARFAELEARVLRSDRGGIYSILQKYFGVRMARQQTQYQIKQLDKEELMVLNWPNLDKVLSLHSLSSDEEGQPLEWRSRLIVADIPLLTVG